MKALGETSKKAFSSEAQAWQMHKRAPGGVAREGVAWSPAHFCLNLVN